MDGDRRYLALAADQENAFLSPDESRVVAEAWRQKGVDARYEEIAGANHFTVLDPLSDANSAMTARCATLAAKCAKDR